MKTEALAHLYDLLHAGQTVKRFVQDKTLSDYENDELLRSAVERKFEIMGEAMNRIHHDTPELVSEIRNYRELISFRNILIHGYDTIDNLIVWDVIQNDLAELLEDVTKLTLLD